MTILADEHIIQVSDPSVLGKKLYFANELCEWQLCEYIWTGCTRVHLRDKIMSHATELIRQIIRKQGLHTIYPGQEESAFGDLLQVAWCITPDTLVMTPGGTTEIGRILPDGDEGECDFEIFGRDGISKAEYFIRRPPAKTYKINLKFGYNIEATGEHPIWVLTDSGPKWVQTSELKIGDLVAVQAGQNIDPLSEMINERNAASTLDQMYNNMICPSEYLANRLRVSLLNLGVYTDTHIVEENETKLYKLERISNYNPHLEIRWFPIKSITYNISETVDIRVKDTHNFTANGIITHNCQVEKTLYKYRACAHCRNCFKYDRPSESVLYRPAYREYGIITMDKIVKDIKYCPRCGCKLSEEPIVQPKQGTYGGSETILYRGSSKVFNLWSQISRTVILAYIKKEARDRKNCTPYTNHLCNKPKPIGDMMSRFLTEVKTVCQYNDDFIKIADALDWIIHNDERSYNGIISKLTKRSGLSRSTVMNFIRYIKLRSCDFTDSPISRNISENQPDRSKDDCEFDDE